MLLFKEQAISWCLLISDHNEGITKLIESAKDEYLRKEEKKKT